MDTHRDKVLQERRKRGWSVRRAAGAGHISNTTWGRYESGELELSGAIRNAITVAFAWPPDWPDTHLDNDRHLRPRHRSRRGAGGRSHRAGIRSRIACTPVTPAVGVDVVDDLYGGDDAA